MTDNTQVRTHKFQAEVNKVLSLVINSLYSNKEIFLRELVSNASDALDKLRFKAITEPDLVGEDETLRVRLLTDKDAGTLTIADNGIGMTDEELIANLGTIAHSGSKAFLEGLGKKNGDVSLIGEFGVGFYSAYLVADKVTVITRAAGSDKAWQWVSDAQGEYTVEPAEREERGTSVILHLGEEHLSYVEDWTVRNLVSRYSDYVDHPIEMRYERKTGEGEEEVIDVGFERVNQAKALWQRTPSEIDDAQYEEFYRHLTHDWEGPLNQTHFKIEGTQLFTGLLFIPKRPPFDLFDPDRRHGVRLYVKRVFIMDDCEEMLPRWLRFMRGVIDSDDLPLNVSRELLQDSSLVRTIQKQVVRKSLDLLEEMAEKDKEAYATFWNNYGTVLKEGIHQEPRHKDRIAALLRFESTSGEGLVGLKEYIERMPFSQKAVYYAMGPNRRTVESSPHLEAAKKRGYEILFMTDAIDQWVVQGLGEFEDKKLVSVMTADLDLEDPDEDKEEKTETVEAFKSLTERFESVLTEKVQTVRVSNRLTDSPVCLVIPEGGMHAHIERLLRLNNQDVPTQKRILEVNPDHKLIKGLQALQDKNGESTQVTEWIEMLYDQALLAEGSPIEDPASFAARMTGLMSSAVSREIEA